MDATNVDVEEENGKDFDAEKKITARSKTQSAPIWRKSSRAHFTYKGEIKEEEPRCAVIQRDDNNHAKGCREVSYGLRRLACFANTGAGVNVCPDRSMPFHHKGNSIKKT